MIIDSSYFQGGKTHIPHTAGNPSINGNVPSKYNELESYIERYEEELLLGAIGYTNYEALKAAKAADATLALPENAIWKDLVKGKAYTFEGTQVKWNGLIQEGTLKTSLIANYVFYHYLIDDFQNYTAVGMQKESAKNATGQSPDLKLTHVWREFIAKYQDGAVVQPIVRSTSFGSYTDYFSGNLNPQRSLYQFLNDNDNYGDYNFTMYENRNRFGL